MSSTGSNHGLVQIQLRESLGELQNDWDELVQAQALKSPFLRSWWLENACAGRPAILCVLADGILIGGAAFEIGRFGPAILGIEKLSVAGGGLLAPDHVDLLSAPGHHQTVTREVLRWMLRPGSRVIELDGLAADGTLARLFGDSRTGVFKGPFAELPSDPAQYLASRPGKVRSTVKRRSKQLEAAGVRFAVADQHDLDRALQVFSELHELRWADESGFLDAFERFSNAVRAGAAQGDVLIHELRLESGGTVAIEIDLVLGNRMAFYQSGRDTEHEWRGGGTVLRFRIIEAAIGAGMTEYDMLRGDERYKGEWATSYRMLSSHHLAVGIRAKAAQAARDAISRIRDRRTRHSSEPEER